LEVCKIAARFDKEVFCYWVDIIETVDMNKVQDIFQAIPAAYMGNDTRRFAQKMIEVNRGRLMALREEVCS